MTEFGCGQWHQLMRGKKALPRIINRCFAHQEIRFLGKIGFLKQCLMCPRNPMFEKNRISQTVPNVPKKSDFLFGKIGFLLK
jgi:hypothetical protein